MLSKKKRNFTIVTALLLISACALGITLALIKANTETVTNEFKGAMVNIAVLENNTDYELGYNDNYAEAKKNVAVHKVVQVKNKNVLQNDSDYPTTDTFVRVRLVPILRNKDTHENIGVQVQVQYKYSTSTRWKKQVVDGESFYYYTEAIKPGEVSDELIESVTVTSDMPDNAYLELQVLADGVQARPNLSATNNIEETPVFQAWGLYPPTASLAPLNN